MSKWNAQKKISQTQMYPLAFNPSESPTSWVSLKFEKSIGNNVDYLVIQKAKTKKSTKKLLADIFSHTILWNAFIMAVVIGDYFVSSTIYVYNPPSYPFDWEFCLTLICDGIYVLDVISSILLKIIAWRQPNIIENPKHISLIIVDGVLALPYAAGYLLRYETVTSRVFLLLRLITWLRLYRLAYFFICYENTTRRHRWVIFYIKFFLYVIVIEHSFACAWYALINFNGTGTGVETGVGTGAGTGTATGIRIWSNSITNSTNRLKPVRKWYLITSYFSTTILSHTGFGDLFPVNINERFLTIIIMSSGFLIWSYYVSSLITLLLRSRYPRYKIQKQLILILQYLNLIAANKDLEKQCVKYYQAFWDKDNGVVTSKQLADLPNAIAIYMNQKSCSFILKCTIIFNNKPASFLRNVCLYIKHEFYLPGQNIYDEKKLKEKMIIIRTGVIDILSEEDNETPIVSLGPGTCLGEAALVITGLPSKVNVRSSAYTEVYAIYAKDFCKIITTYPDFYADIRKSITGRINKRLLITSKSKTSWKDLKQILRDKDNLSNISTPIITRYVSLYKIASSPKAKSSKKKNKFSLIRNDDTISMFIWELFIAISAIAVAAFYPYFVVFDKKFPPLFDLISHIINIIFVFDIFVLLTTSIVKQGRRIDTLKGILNERMDTLSFHLDVFACFYLEVYSPLFEDEDKSYYWLKLNRLLKIVRVSTFCNRLGNKLTMCPCIIACVKYVIFLFFFLYWSALVMYVQTCFYPNCIYDGWFLTKLKNNVYYRYLTRDAYGKFFVANYYSLSNTLSVGIGDIIPANSQDIIYSMLLIILGQLIFGYSLAEITALYTLRLSHRNEFEDLMRGVQFYVNKRSIPYKLEARIKTYFDIQWRYNEAHSILERNSLLFSLPKHFCREIFAREKFATLKKFIIFDEMNEEFLDYLMDKSKTLIVGPDEIITYFGSINREMYFVCKGFCLKQTENNTYETIGPGSSIGFSSLLFGLPSLNNVCTLTHCVLIYINVQTFNAALQQAPLLYRTVYRTRQLILAKYQSNYEVKMIENPHYTKRKRRLKLKYKNLNQRLIKNESFVNAYKFCVSNKESYSKLSKTAGKICLLKYLLMPISILPYGPFLKCWYTLRLILATIYFFAVPIEYLFSPYLTRLYYCRFILDIFVYTDMYWRFHVAFYGDKNQLVIHPWTTAENYLKGQFLFDILIWFPYPAIITIFFNHTEGHSIFAHSFTPHFFHCGLNLIKILDIYRVFTMMVHLNERLNTYTAYRCFKYFFFTIVLVHSWSIILIITTCKYLHHDDVARFVDGNVTKVPGMMVVPKAELNLYCYDHSWLNRSIYHNYTGVSQVYFTAVYFVFQTMTGVGFGDIYAEDGIEILMTILILLSGLAFYGYVMTDIISNSARRKHALLVYESKFLHLISYMRQQNVDSHLSMRVQDCLQYKWNRTRNIKIYSLLSHMNSTLHEDVVLYLYEPTLRHVPMFEMADHSFFRVIAKELREEYFIEGDTVVRVNDIVQDIYIIHRGSVELSNAHNMIPVIMGIGGVFGNVFEKDKSLCGISARALKNLDLLCLNVETFRKLLKDYPFIQKKLNLSVKNEKPKHYAIPSSFLEDGNVYLSPNMYWSTKQQLTNKKKSFFSSFKNSFNYDTHRITAFSCFILFAAYCNFILTTYQFCFQQYCNILLTTAVIIDVIFLLKFCMEINAPSVAPPTFSTKKTFLAKCMRRRWRRTLDFIANLPIGYSILFVPFISNERANFYLSTYRLLTLLRLYYIFQFLVEHRERLLARRFFLELSILVIFSTITCHLFACLWYLIICPWNQCSSLLWTNFQGNHTPEQLYILSLYMVINTITCTGIGDLVLQTKRQICVIITYMAIAKIFLGYFIAQLIKVLQCGNVLLMKYETIMEHLKTYYANLGVHKSQVNYMNNYMRMLWRKRNGIQRYELITELPRTLKIDLMTSIYGKLIKDSYIFCRTERDFIRQLCLHVEHRTYFPGDYIVRDGDVDSCMYFIHKGDVQILTDGQNVNETVHEVLHKEEVFGIVQGLFKEIPHHFSFRALTIADIASLKLSEWEYLLDFFPSTKDIIYQRVEEIYYTI